MIFKLIGIYSIFTFNVLSQTPCALINNNPYYQRKWNRKGLISDGGHKKDIFYQLKRYYVDKKK